MSEIVSSNLYFVDLQMSYQEKQFSSKLEGRWS